MSENESKGKEPFTHNENFLRFVFPTLLLSGVFACIGLNSVINWIDGNYPEYGIAEKFGNKGMIGSVRTSDVRSDGEHGALSSLNSDINSNENSSTYEDSIFGYEVVCTFINTKDWGYPEHYDSAKPEIRTADEAMQRLAMIGYLGEKVIIQQGEHIRIVNVDSPELDILANQSAICIVK